MRNINCIVSILTMCFNAVTVAQDQVMLKTCTLNNLLSCPKYSLCTRIANAENAAPKCVCTEGLQLNLNWSEYEYGNSSMLLQEHYCLPSNEISTTQENKFIVYMRSPARKEHLVFGILMVLMAAALATAVLYGIKALNVLKRTKSVYRKLRYKSQHITPLQETDELELNRRYEMQTL